MNTKFGFLGLLALLAGTTLAQSAAPSTSPARIGVYDSRVIAYAYFWSNAAQAERDALIASAKAAKLAGDEPRAKELGAKLAASQKRIHEQCFSTAPADEAMAALQDKLPAIERELGLTRFVSKWDTKALREILETDRVDVTDRLTAEFTLTPKQAKTVETIKSTPPVSLWKIKLLHLLHQV
jgi:hypothetical protein